MLKVLFLTRPDLLRVPAGDTVQIISLQKYLNKEGIKVELSTEMKPDLRAYDLVHYFNILRIEHAFYQCKWVKKQGKPLILTPIYWNMEEYLEKYRPELLEFWFWGQKKRKELLGKYVDLLVPNSRTEYLLIQEDFRVKLPWSVIYNGVEPYFYYPKKEGRGVLSVARIHSRKNQLLTINALGDTGLELYLIGEINDPNYYRRCLEAAQGKRVFFLSGRKPKELVYYYRRARVHVLASWYDTPGLVNLEAGLAGCNLVSTKRGTAQEYLGEEAWYVEPGEVRDIREKVLQAYEVPLHQDLAERILQEYSWPVVARKSSEIYSQFISAFI